MNQLTPTTVKAFKDAPGGTDGDTDEKPFHEIAPIENAQIGTREG